MGKYFSDAVDQALEDIYYCYDAQRAAAAIQPLTDAAGAGDGDAAYLLFRCACGPDYSWEYHLFQENQDAAFRFLRSSVLQGSAMGVLGANRGRMLTPELEEAVRARFTSLKGAWNAVYEKAEAGCLFAMNLIGSSYYWLDIVQMEGKKAGDFPSQEEFDAYLRENILKSVPWFEKAFRGGMGVAGRNWYNVYHQGQEGLLSPDRKKAEEIACLGAELGYPDWQEMYGNWIKDEPGQGQRAAEFFQSAAGQGQLSAWFYLGMLYYEGKFIPQDRPRALKCFEASVARSANSACMAGVLYYSGEGGVRDHSFWRTLRPEAPITGWTCWLTATSLAAAASGTPVRRSSSCRSGSITPISKATTWAPSTPRAWASRRTSKREWSISRSAGTTPQLRRHC